MKKYLLIALTALVYGFLHPLLAETRTWSFEWNKSKKDPTSQGFYNFGANLVEKEFYTTELNGLTWNISSKGTYKYAYLPTAGQSIGTASQPSTHTELWTNSLSGIIKAVRVVARTNKEQFKADLSLSVGGNKYLCDGVNRVAINNKPVTYEFKPSDLGSEGKLMIAIDPTSNEKSTLYIKRIEIDYEIVPSVVNAPIFSLPGGIYDKVQEVTISALDGMRVYYTTDNSNPRLEENHRQLYKEPIRIDKSLILKAVAFDGTSYSDVVQADYVIRIDPKLSFTQDSISLITGQDSFADLLNPFNVEPIKYSSSDWRICSVDGKGTLYSSYVEKEETVIIKAVFPGNDTYLPAQVSMKVTVVPKDPLATPEINPLGGTFSGPVEVSISTADDRAVTIWYSTEAKSTDEFENDYTKSVITEGKKVSLTIDKSCTLYVMTRGDNVNSPIVTADYVINSPLKANFTTDKSFKSYFSQNFDNQKDLETWQVGLGWKLENKNFSLIDKNDKSSIAIDYEGSGQTTLTSPEVLVKPKSLVSFYAYFSGVFLVHGSWQLNIIDMETNKVTQLFDAFSWAQDNGYTGPAWNNFQLDLAAFEGKKVKFEFVYNYGGENLALDQFSLMAEDPEAVSIIHIFEGEKITFTNTSLGEPDGIEWIFNGGTPASSKENKVEVTYPIAGAFDVVLKAKKGEKIDVTTRKSYIVVSKKAPEALIGLPEEGYESPFVGVFIPTNVPVTFRDLSLGNPTAWEWTFQNTDVSKSNEQNPTVTYLEKGRFSVGLSVKNEAGTSRDMLTYAIQAGGAQNVWNISTDENKKLSKIELGWYGNYAGSNWLGIRRFAERYKATLADATIDSVSIYFASNTTVSPNSDIVLTINSIDKAGNPGDIIATTSIKTSDIKYSNDDYLETWFHFETPVKIDKGKEFFIVIGPFPNVSDNESNKTDDLAMFCCRRTEGQKCTTWHELEDQDEKGNGLGTYKWIQNIEDPLSMAIAPVVTYDKNITSVQPIPVNNQGKEVEYVIDINGIRVSCMLKGEVYIIRYTDGTTEKVLYQ
ncbi:chitobiase/beta-hexosaminidase C-terminal domain-containing protein [Falsiporphyromonas endometrii]|uniref:Chitobiase/beta-hexosaminidase C-terminal domain-containing protein n=1 Tax=Falsiporphyromonas endometrii TaxID=1387297 RepID=A0ABV9K5Y2_9PORP